MAKFLCLNIIGSFKKVNRRAHVIHIGKLPRLRQACAFVRSG